MAVRPSVFFFFNSGQQGWSERYWSTLIGPLSDVQDAGTKLLAKRVKMLAQGIVVPWAYASYDDEFRDVLPLKIPTPNPGQVWNVNFVDNPDQPNVAIAARFAAGTRAGKFTYLSGVPDIVVAYPPRYEPVVPAEWDLPWQQFRDELINKPWGWKGLSYDPLVAPTTAVTIMTLAAGNWDAVVTTTVGFKAGKKAKLSGGTFAGVALQSGNRIYTVKEIVDATHLTLSWDGAQLQGLTYVGDGTLQQQTYSILKITDGTLEKITTRKRGVGFGRPVGRRKRLKKFSQ